MRVALWIVQIVLALAFLAHGIMFLHPPAQVAAMMNAFLPRWFQLFLGVAEVLAAIGLTLPGLTRIQPGLVPLAAVGVTIVTVSATILHTARAKYSSATTTLVLTLLAAFVAWGRFRKAPIAAR